MWGSLSKKDRLCLKCGDCSGTAGGVAFGFFVGYLAMTYPVGSGWHSGLPWVGASAIILWNLGRWFFLRRRIGRLDPSQLNDTG